MFFQKLLWLVLAAILVTLSFSWSQVFSSGSAILEMLSTMHGNPQVEHKNGAHRLFTVIRGERDHVYAFYVDEGWQDNCRLLEEFLEQNKLVYGVIYYDQNCDGVMSGVKDLTTGSLQPISEVGNTPYTETLREYLEVINQKK